MPIERPTRVTCWDFDGTLAHRAGLWSGALLASITHLEFGMALAGSAALVWASEQDFTRAWFAIGDSRATGVFSSTEDSIRHIGQLVGRTCRAQARAVSP